MFNNLWHHSDSDESDYFSNNALEFYVAAHFLISSENLLDSKEKQLERIKFIRFIPSVLLFVSSVFMGYQAYLSEPDSLLQSYLIEFSSGATIFLLFPVIFFLAKKRYFLTYSFISLLVAIVFYISTVTSSVTQSFFVEATIGLVLLLSLDIFFKYIIKQLNKIKENAMNEINKIIRNIDDAEESIHPDPRSFAIGDRMEEETMNFNLIKKNIEICQILSSDKAYEEKDLIYTINTVNEMKRNNFIEYSRLKGYLDLYK